MGAESDGARALVCVVLVRPESREENSGNHRISHACGYLISEYFYILVIMARLPALYNEVFLYTHGHSHHTEPIAHQQPVMEHVPEILLCL